MFPGWGSFDLVNMMIGGAVCFGVVTTVLSRVMDWTRVENRMVAFLIGWSPTLLYVLLDYSLGESFLIAQNLPKALGVTAALSLWLLWFWFGCKSEPRESAPASGSRVQNQLPG